MGHTIGSRVAVAATAEEAFGPQGNPELNVGNKDTVVAVVDLLSTVPDGPEGAEKPPPAGRRRSSRRTACPTSPRLHRDARKPRQEAPVRHPHRGRRARPSRRASARRQLPRPGLPGQEAVRRELQPRPAGLVPDRRRRGHPRLGQDAGRRQGRQPGDARRSRPRTGYGKAGNEQAGIKGTDTLYFVVDVLAAGLTTGGIAAAVASDKSERLLNLLIMLLVQRHYVSKDRIRVDPLPRGGGRGVREDVRARQGGPAQHRRPDRGRQHRPATSRTSRATGSAPTSSSCPTSRLTGDEAAVVGARRRGSGSTPAWPRPPPRRSAS